MKRYILIAALVLAGTVASAQDITADKLSGTSMTFSRIGRNPAALGMGNTSLLETSFTGYSAFGNIAALPFSSNMVDGQLSYQMWAPKSPSSSTNINAGVGFNIKDKIGISASFSSDKSGTSMLAPSRAVVDKTILPSSMMLGVGFSYRFIPQLSVGVNARYLSQQLSEHNPFTDFGVDVLLMSSFSGVKIAGGITSLGGKVKSTDSKSFSLPTAASLAAGYEKVFGEKHGIDVRAEAEYYLAGGFRAALGASYAFNDMVFVRAGYNFGGVCANFASVGLGVKFFGVNLNLAYLLGDSPAGGTLCAGLGYSFGKKKK